MGSSPFVPCCCTTSLRCQSQGWHTPPRCSRTDAWPSVGCGGGCWLQAGGHVQTVPCVGAIKYSCRHRGSGETLPWCVRASLARSSSESQLADRNQRRAQG